MYKMHPGEQFRKLREKAGFSRRILADRWGISESWIVRWERERGRVPFWAFDALYGMVKSKQPHDEWEHEARKGIEHIQSINRTKLGKS